MAIAHISERRERAEHVPVILRGAVVGLHPPQRDQHRTLDAELLFDGLKRLCPVLGFALATLNAAARGDVIDIGAYRLAVFRLPFGGGDHARIGRDAFEGELEGGAGDAFGLSVMPKCGLEGGKGLLAVLRLYLRAAQGQNDALKRRSGASASMTSGAARFDLFVIAAIPIRRRGAPAVRQFRVPIERRAQWPVTSATGAPGRRSPSASAPAARRCGRVRFRRARY